PLPVPVLVVVAAVARAAAVLSHRGPSVSSFVSLYAVIFQDPKRAPRNDPRVRARSVTAFTGILESPTARIGALTENEPWSCVLSRTLQEHATRRGGTYHAGPSSRSRRPAPARR